jgi:hypothetical protein
MLLYEGNVLVVIVAKLCGIRQFRHLSAKMLTTDETHGIATLEL